MRQQIKTIDDIAEFLKGKGEKLKPVEENQISILEQKFKIKLPHVYKRFLRLMGKGAGTYMLGSSVFFDDVINLNQWAIELTKENNLEALPNNAFVFWMHQGYQAAYFLITDNEDPPVYYYSESNPINSSFVLQEESITNFFLSQLKFTFPEAK